MKYWNHPLRAAILTPIFFAIALASPAAGEKPKADLRNMAEIPAGCFKMGAADGSDREQPVHGVCLDKFYLDVFEVTVEQYRRCVAQGGCEAIPLSNDYPDCNWQHYDRSIHPANCVAWEDAGSYCKWAGKRLPTEAEWEFAARGPESLPFPWGTDPTSCFFAVVTEKDDEKGCARRSTWPVGSKSKGITRSGVHDMMGNVWEWVADWFDPDYYRKSPKQNPTGPATGEKHVLRGGSWGNKPKHANPSYRWSYPSVRGNHLIGFRCAADAGN